MLIFMIKSIKVYKNLYRKKKYDEWYRNLIQKIDKLVNIINLKKKIALQNA